MTVSNSSQSSVKTRTPRFGDVKPRANEIVGAFLGRRFRRVKVPGTFQQIPKDLFVNYIFKNLTLKDLAAVKRICKNHLNWANEYISTIYKRLNSCVPLGLVFKIEYSRWMALYRNPTHQLTNPPASPELLTFEMMGNNTFKFWKKDNLACFALRYFSDSSEGPFQGILIFYQISSFYWRVVSPCDPERVGSVMGILYYGGSSSVKDEDDKAWNYFSDLMHGIGQRGISDDAHITLWDEKKWNKA